MSESIPRPEYTSIQTYPPQQHPVASTTDFKKSNYIDQFEQKAHQFIAWTAKWLRKLDNYRKKKVTKKRAEARKTETKEVQTEEPRDMSTTQPIEMKETQMMSTTEPREIGASLNNLSPAEMEKIQKNDETFQPYAHQPHSPKLMFAEKF